MVKFAWSGLGVSLAAASLAIALGTTAAQARSGTPSWSIFGGGAQEDAMPVTINGQVTARGGKSFTTTRLVGDGSEAPFMYSGSLQAMQAAESHYQQIAAQGGWGKLSSGRYKPGSQGKDVAALNRRLMLEGYLGNGAGAAFTAETQRAVSEFQHNHGLPITGTVDSATLRELNVPVEQRLATMRANEPRIAHNGQALGSRYVIVNVPAMQLEAVQDGRVYSIHNVIVGRPSRPTPVVITHLETIRFNPYWNAPASIVQRDIIPRMLSGGPKAVMDQMNMKIFKGYNGPEVEPNSVNWRTANPADYYFRQEPGGSNAMATAKIEFNSPFGIYLHDTPEPELFNSAQRFYSSGCVRVQNVALLLNWILNGQDGFGPAKIAELAKTKERLDVTLQNPPQIRVAYLTAWPLANGTVAFRPDVYQMDGSGFVVGQPNPVGQGGERYTLKPVPWQAAAIASEGGGDFFSKLFGGSSGRNAANTVAAPTVKAQASKAKLATATATTSAKAKKPFNFFESLSAPSKSKTADAAGKTVKKKPLATDATKVAKATAAKPSTAKPVADASKTAASCKADKAGKLPAGCKAAAAVPAVAKPKPKPATTASAN